MLLFPYWVIFHAFLSSADFLSKSTCSKNSFSFTIRVSNSLDPDQARCFVGPDMGSNCFRSYQQTTLGDNKLNRLFLSFQWIKCIFKKFLP